MGWQNVYLVMRDWITLPSNTLRVLLVMGKVSLDESTDEQEARIYWRGWEYLAVHALGKEISDETQRRTAKRKVLAAISDAEAKGAVRRLVEHAHNSERQEYLLLERVPLSDTLRESEAKERVSVSDTLKGVAFRSERVSVSDTPRNKEDSSRGTRPRLPLSLDAWRPSDEHAEIARLEGVDLAEEAEGFRRWTVSKGLHHRDVDAAFRTWLLNR